MPSRLVNLANKHAEVFEKGFLPWLAANEHMYHLFEALADQLWERGRRHYSSRTIGEKMRFDYDVSSVGDPFKLNNNYTPDLGRLYVLRHPKRVLLFEYRRTKKLDFLQYMCKHFGLTIVPLPANDPKWDVPDAA